MAEGDSPTVARRRVRLALRDAREAAEITQNQVAEEMEWSLSKVIRIENGDVSISPNDLRPLLAYLGIRDRATVAAMLADARLARTRQQAWYQTTEFRESLTDATRKLIEYENEASEIRHYATLYVPGALQLPEYSAALMSRFEEELTREQIQRRLRARAKRRESLLARDGKVQMFLLADESVLRRVIGGPEVFAAQLRELLRLAERGTAVLRMVPFELHAPVTNNASFDLMMLSEGEVLYRETGLGDEILEDRDSIAKHRNRFEKVWDEVADEADTIDFIRRHMERLEAG